MPRGKTKRESIPPTQSYVALLLYTAIAMWGVVQFDLINLEIELPTQLFFKLELQKGSEEEN